MDLVFEELPGAFIIIGLINVNILKPNTTIPPRIHHIHSLIYETVAFLSFGQ